MARETISRVQAIKAVKIVRLKAAPPIQCKSPSTGRRDSGDPVTTNAAVVALPTLGDAELGEYDEEATIVFKTERLPAPFEEA